MACWPNDKPPAEEMACTAKYVPYGKHKNYASPLWSFVRSSDASKCDSIGAKHFDRLTALLREAIKAPGVSAEFRGNYPAHVWAYVNDVLHQGMLMNQETGVYHGFPLILEEQYPRDPDGLLEFSPRVQIP
ncbi:MAG: hypothetical protein ACREJ2_01810 [Planctomycetota bacterium]